MHYDYSLGVIGNIQKLFTERNTVNGRVDNTNSDLSQTNQNVTKVKETNDISFVTLSEAGIIDDVTAGEHTEIFEEWVWPKDYLEGNIRKYEGSLYRCIQEHTSQEEWTPAAAVSLWTKIADPAEEWPAWSQPVGASDAYMKDAKVSHNDKHWVSEVDNNVWEPGVYGWVESE